MIQKKKCFSLIGQPDEKRKGGHRTWSFFDGKIQTKDASTTLDCIVKDYSWFGAKLVMKNYMSLPTEFDLVLNKSINTLPIHCKVIWRTATDIGVEFSQ